MDGWENSFIHWGRPQSVPAPEANNLVAPSSQPILDLQGDVVHEYVSSETVKRFAEAPSKKESFHTAVLRYEQYNLFKDYQDENTAKIKFMEVGRAQLCRLSPDEPFKIKTKEDGTTYEYTLQDSPLKKETLLIEKRLLGEETVVSVVEVPHTNRAKLKEQAIAEIAKDVVQTGNRIWLHLITEQAKSGCAQARYQLALFYLRGCAGLSRNKKLALEQLNYASNSGHLDAKYLLAKLQLIQLKSFLNLNLDPDPFEVTVDRDPSHLESKFFWNWATMLQRVGAIGKLGEKVGPGISLREYSEIKTCYFRMESFREQFTQANFLLMWLDCTNKGTAVMDIKLVKTLADKGCVLMQFQFALMTPEKGERQKYLELSAKQGFAPAQFYLAMTMPKSDTRRQELLLASAAQDYPKALFHLGFELLPANTTAAMKYLGAAKELGCAEAGFLLGMKACQVDLNPLLSSLGSAAAQGFAPALLRLGLEELRLHNLEQNPVYAMQNHLLSAINYFKMAAQQGHVRAQYHLSKLLVDYCIREEKKVLSFQQARQTLTQLHVEWKTNLSGANRPLGCFQAGMVEFYSGNAVPAEEHFVNAGDHAPSKWMLWFMQHSNGSGGMDPNLNDAAQQGLPVAVAVKFLTEQINGKDAPVYPVLSPAIPADEEKVQSEPLTDLNVSEGGQPNLLNKIAKELGPIVSRYVPGVDITSDSFASQPWYLVDYWDEPYFSASPTQSTLAINGQTQPVWYNEMTQAACIDITNPAGFHVASGLMRWHPLWFQFH